MPFETSPDMNERTSGWLSFNFYFFRRLAHAEGKYNPEMDGIFEIKILAIYGTGNAWKIAGLKEFLQSS